MGENMGFGRGPGDQGSDVLRQETHAFVKEKTLVLHRMDAHNIRVVAGVSGRSLVDVVYGVCAVCVQCVYKESCGCSVRCVSDVCTVCVQCVYSVCTCVYVCVRVCTCVYSVCTVCVLI